ncbi:MAG: GNAT family N-acetyltransferase [Oceanihabitans sp.]
MQNSVQFKVVKYNPSFFKEWNNFIASAKNATFLFHRDFIEYHQDRFKDYSLLVFKNTKLVAVLPANVNASTLYSHQGLTYGAFVVSPDTKMEAYLASFKAVLQYLNEQGITTLNLKIIPNIYNRLPSDEIDYLMFVTQAQLLKRETLSVVDYRNEITISKNRKEGVKKANTHNLIIKEETNFDAFWNAILIPNLQEKYQTKPVHSLNEINLLKSRFPNNIKQFNVYNENEIVAGATIFESKYVAHTQYISANTNKNTLGSLDFLHAHLLNAFAHKRYFDFGTSNQNNGKQINYGLQFWKEGFGAKIIIQDLYSINTANVKLLNGVLI